MPGGRALGYRHCKAVRNSQSQDRLARGTQHTRGGFKQNHPQIAASCLKNRLRGKFGIGKSSSATSRTLGPLLRAKVAERSSTSLDTRQFIGDNVETACEDCSWRRMKGAHALNERLGELKITLRSLLKLHSALASTHTTSNKSSLLRCMSGEWTKHIKQVSFVAFARLIL